MKQVLALLTIAATMSFANPTPDGISVTAAFSEGLKKEFPDAANIRWEKAGEYYLATFTYHNERISTYFNDEATLHKVTRYISADALPLNIQIAFRDKFDLPGDELTVMEVMRDGFTSYFISFRKNNRQFIVESDTAGNLQVIKNIK